VFTAFAFAFSFSFSTTMTTAKWIAARYAFAQRYAFA
jgi:hypothetical protein